MIYDKTEKDIIVADGFSELSERQKKLLLASENPDNPDAVQFDGELIKNVDAGVYNKIKTKFRDQTYRDKVFSELDKNRIGCITVKSKGYPERLKETPSHPLVLYVRGNAELLRDRLFGVVGSRTTTAPVLEECKRICSALTRHLTIVTGVADGADSAAIRGSLESGKIICVLPGGHNGSGVSNIQLIREVERYGLTISGYPPNVKAQKFSFVRRNQILAGLCEGVLVVSAGKKSGAKSTANYAVDYSRELFAFPYAPNSTTGVGCNELIKHGAYLCDCADDVFGILGIDDGEVAAVAETPLEGDENEIYEMLKREGETHAGKLADVLGKTLTEIITACAMLEIKGLVVRTGGNAYAAI